MVMLFILGPDLHYFISGEYYNNSELRNILVGLQIITGAFLTYYFWPTKKQNENSSN